MDTSLLALLEGLGTCFTAIILGGGFLIILSYLFVTGQRRRQEAWRELAARLGLDYEADELFAERIEGSYRGRYLLLERVPRGEDKAPYTHVRVPVHNDADVYLHLAPAGTLSAPGRTTSNDEVTVGAPELDKAYTIHTRPDAFAAQLLAPTRLRSRLLSLGKLELKIQRHHVDVLLFHDVADTALLQNVFDLLCDMAEATDALAPQWLPVGVGVWSVGV